LGVALPTPTVSGDTATYAEVLPGVDVVARASVESVSTFVVVKTREAGKNPAVRGLRFALSGAGGGARATATGDVVVADAAGKDRVRLSAAAMWDSTGTAAGVASKERVTPAAQAQGRGLKVAVAEAGVSVAPDAAFLDDPATVYPVVIDPTFSDYGADYFKRFVSNDCFYYSSDTEDGLYTGNKARVGYNGWDKSASSCYSYYESELFYRFTWPTSMTGNYIRSARFVHETSYSVQQECDVQHNGSPIDVGITDAFDEDASSWDERPDFLVDPDVFVSNDYAAGSSPTYCSVKQDMEWNLTDQFADIFHDEIAEDVYIAMIAHDDRDRNTWRYFDNIWGAGPASRPLLIVEYAPRPAAPSAVRVAAADALGVQGLWYTPSLRPVLRAVLPAQTACPSSSPCYKARFEVLWRDPGQQSPVSEFTVDSQVGAAGSTVSVRVPAGQALLPDRTYVVRASTVNAAYSDLPASAAVTALSPELRTWTPAGQPVRPTWTAASMTVAPSGSWAVHAATTAGSVSKFCLADAEAAGPGTRCVTTTASSADLTSAALVAGQSPYSFRVWVCYATSECVVSTAVATVWVS